MYKHDEMLRISMVGMRQSSETKTVSVKCKTPSGGEMASEEECLGVKYLRTVVMIRVGAIFALVPLEQWPVRTEMTLTNTYETAQ